MNNFQLHFTVKVPTLDVPAGILLNRQDAFSLRTDLGGRIDLLTGKVIA